MRKLLFMHMSSVLLVVSQSLDKVQINLYNVGFWLFVQTKQTSNMLLVCPCLLVHKISHLKAEICTLCEKYYCSLKNSAL